ncbi:Transmembrane 4 L6 family member 4 [Myotis davidii]|uniref:Transmembrane 4 L6 family member 4 n=1 Tax=Myotis davidii TaxID=225400 RepID=L5LCK0_MYODS|nr:Transmembrane 4 L6 family member 4 [Myotis davidii]
MVEQVSGGTRPRQDTSRCHQGKPLVVTENSLLLCTVVPPGAHTCCWPCSHLLPVLSTSPDHHSGLLPAPEGQSGLAAASRTHSQSHVLPPAPAPLAPAACASCHSHPLLVPSASPDRSALSVGVSSPVVKRQVARKEPKSGPGATPHPLIPALLHLPPPLLGSAAVEEEEACTAAAALASCEPSIWDYLNDKALWSKCREPENVVSWNLTLFSILLIIAVFQMLLCTIQVVNGLLGTLCGDCRYCGCCRVS